MAGKPFQKGQSGNPDGRPKGSRNATTLALETLLDGQATALTQKAIDLALAGDMARVGSYVLRSFYRGRCALQQGCAPAP
jgi:hypothetical protein